MDPARDLPISQVSQMKAQGMDNNKIIQTLQNDGYTSSQIFDAMNSAETPGMPVKEAGIHDLEPKGFADVQMNPSNNQNMYNPYGGGNNPSSQYSSSSNSYPNSSSPSYSDFPTEFQEPLSAGGPSELAPSNEELIEAIIDEKWNDLVDDINKIIDWKNRADARLASIETNIKNLKDEFSNLHQGVLGRIGDYDKNMLNVGAELKAMESMFQKVLPTFLENVQKLEDVADNLTKVKKKA